MTTYRGTNQDDEIFGSSLADVIKGLGGSDFLVGQDGNDRIVGGSGDDEVLGRIGADVLSGGTGDDYVDGGDDNDIVRGGSGSDFVFGQAGDDHLFGNDGDDVLKGGAGLDHLDGGAGQDRLSLDDYAATRGAIVDLQAQLVLDDGFGNHETLISIESLGAGTLFADTFLGSAGDNAISLSVGDTGKGFDGNDTFGLDNVDGVSLDGGAGIDEIAFSNFYRVPNGSGGASFIYADHGVNVDLARHMIFDDGFGHSLALVSIESVTGGILDDRLTGSGGDDSVGGGDGDDHIVGLSGADTIQGGYGNDILTGGLGADTFVYGYFDERASLSGVQTVDTITDFLQGTARKPGDRIDLSSFTETLGETHFIGTAEFSGAPGEIRYEIVDGQTIVSVEAGFRPGVELSINLTGEIALTAADFIL